MVHHTRKNVRKSKYPKKTRKFEVQKTGHKHQCQCTSTCKNRVIDNAYFCEDHKNSCPRVGSLSGYEPDYNPSFWNNNFKIKETHNCFAYAYNINDQKQILKCKNKNCDIPFHQPGSASGYARFKSSNPKTCPNMMIRNFGDNPNIKMARFTDKCPPGTSKIALIVDEDEDYHYLRQDSNGLWSHKPGARNVTNRDASGKRIYDPALADYNYKKNANGYLNYDLFCSYMCVPRITPVRAKVGGGMKGGSTKKVTVAVLYSRSNNDTINLESCITHDWLLLSSGETEISGYQYELVYSGPEYKLKEFTDCLERTFHDYKKNKVIKKYKIALVQS